MPAGEALTPCRDCRYWDHRGNSDGICRRNAPAASDTRLEVARWPETRGSDGCGDGERAVDGVAGAGQPCGTCLFWDRPGEGIEPGPRGDHLATWWRETGFCRRHAPHPRIDIGSHAFWRATNAKDHCFEGRPA